MVFDWKKGMDGGKGDRAKRIIKRGEERRSGLGKTTGAVSGEGNFITTTPNKNHQGPYYRKQVMTSACEKRHSVSP